MWVCIWSWSTSGTLGILPTAEVQDHGSLRQSHVQKVPADLSQGGSSSSSSKTSWSSSSTPILIASHPHSHHHHQPGEEDKPDKQYSLSKDRWQGKRLPDPDSSPKSSTRQRILGQKPEHWQLIYLSAKAPKRGSPNKDHGNYKKVERAAKVPSVSSVFFVLFSPSDLRYSQVEIVMLR